MSEKWTVDRSGFLVIEQHEHGLNTVAQVQPHARTRARARLIAAAPDLIEALEQMVAQEVDYMRLNNLGDPEQQHAVIVARAALAKARGGA